MCNLTPYENGRDSVLSILGYVQIFLVMLWGLMLKVQAFAEGADKEMLGVLLILVNLMVLVVAMGVLVVSFFRNQEDDYQSENPLAVLKREISAAKEAARVENEGTGETGGAKKIEIGEINKGGREGSFENVAGAGEGQEDSFTEKLRMGAKQFHRDKNYPAPVMPRTGMHGGWRRTSSASPNVFHECDARKHVFRLI